MQLGVAFQIADDLLDLTGDEQNTGKSQGTDIAERKMTLPLIHLLREGEEADRADALEMLRRDRLDVDEVHRIRDMLNRNGSMEYARNAAKSAAESAAICLSSLKASPERDTLKGLTEFVVARAH